MTKFYITDAIPYTNAPAHIGHAVGFIQSDVLARYHRKKGEDVVLMHGADENGTKNFRKAQENNKDTQTHVDEITEAFKQAHTKLNISYDRFVRTTSTQHVKAVQSIWKKLVDNDDIYKGTYTGWYCVGCEEFVPEATAKANGYQCPIHEKKYDKLEEENYFFKLSKYQEKLKKAIESDELHIVPEARKHEILRVIDDGLSDISVSRPVDKLPWGVPVPGDKAHIVYIWFDAVICYITALGYPGSEDMDTYWPADVQIIGKDILRFHAAIWPAMLMSAGLEPARNLVVHGFIGSEGKKMSKSLGNNVDPLEVIDEYSTDALRYYLLRHVPPQEDGDFTWQKFERAYNSELGNDLGNLVQRLAAMLMRYQNGVIGEIPEFEHDEAQYHLALRDFRFDKALDAVWVKIQGLNQYLEEEKPWEIAKTEEESHLQDVLAYSVSSLLQIADLLEPFLPHTAEQIQKVFASGVVDDSVGILFPRKDLYNVEA